MIVFTSIPPEDFAPYIGYGSLRHVKRVIVYNLCSYDVRYYRLNLMPTVEDLSEEAYVRDDTTIFECEYYNCIAQDIGKMIDLVRVMSSEYNSGANVLILIEIMPENDYCQSVVSSLVKYIFLKYGVCATVVNDAVDIENIRMDHSNFTPVGVYNIGMEILAVQQVAPDVIDYGEVPDRPRIEWDGYGAQ